MARYDNPAGGPHPISARFFLWTIRKQDHITHWFAMNMWAAVSAVLVSALIGLVSLERALQIILAGGLAAGGIIWILIERRRSWLLGIADPKLKAEAHRAMLVYLCEKLQTRSACRQHLNGADAHPVAETRDGLQET